MARLIPYLVAFVAALVTLGFLFHLSETSIWVNEERQDGYMEERQDGYMEEHVQLQAAMCRNTQENRTRVSIGAGPGALVQGWPSKGGVYMLEDCSGIELDFLNLDRFRKTPQPDPSGPDAAAEEEAHCNRMLQLGAIWWESGEEWLVRKLMEPNEPDLRRAKRFIKVGWPAAGGVWVLDIKEDDAITRDAGIIHNAHDMEERCRLIEQLGGVFYEDPKNWVHAELP